MALQSSLPKGKLPHAQERAPTILVIDDEALIRVMLSDYLQECGFKVLEASNADEAILIIEQRTLLSICCLVM
jgi:CheY-like chemotaxis protein